MKKAVVCLWNFMLQPKRAVIFLTVLAIASGIFWSHNSWGQPPDGDGVLYNKMAENFLATHQLSLEEEGGFTISQVSQVVEPLYSFFLAGIYQIFGRGNFDAVRVVQVFLFALTVLIIYILTLDLAGKTVAFFVSVFLIFCFPLAELTGHFFREVFFTFLVVLLVLALYKSQETTAYFWFFLAGIMLAIASLLNGVILYFIFFALACYLMLYGRGFVRREKILKLLLFCLPLLSVMIFWHFASQWLGAGSLTEKSGLVLERKVEMMQDVRGGQYYKNLVGQVFGYYFVDAPDFDYTKFLEPHRSAEKFLEMAINNYQPSEISRIFFREDAIYILKNPGSFLAITLLDFLQFNNPMFINPVNFNVGPMQNLFIMGTHPEIPPAGKVAILIILRLFYWMFVWFVIYGLVKAVREWRKFIWILLIILYFNLVYSAVFGLPRYAIPIYPFYILLFVMGATTAWNKYAGYNAKKCELICEICER